MKHIRIDGALDQTVDGGEFGGFLFINGSEFFADDAPLFLGIGHAFQLGHEAGFGVHQNEIHAHLLKEYLADRFGIALAHESGIYIYTVQLLTHRMMHQHCADRGVHAARKRHQRIARAHLLTDAGDRRIDEGGDRPPALAAADVVEEIVENGQTLGVVGLDFKLDAEQPLFFIGERGGQAFRFGDGTEVFRQIDGVHTLNKAFAAGNAVKQRTGGVHLHFQYHFIQLHVLDLAAQLADHLPRASAHGQNRRAHQPHAVITFLLQRLASAGHQNALRIDLGNQVDRRIVGQNFGINARAAQHSSQRLRLIAAAEIKNEYGMLVHFGPSE